MRVLHIQKATGIGGSERHLLELLPALSERGIVPRLCVLVAGDGERLVSEARSRDIDVIAVPAGPDWNLLLIPRLAAAIRRFRADLVHTHLLHADVYGQLAAWLLKAPAVSSVHATADVYRRQPGRSGAWLAGHLATRTIAISHHAGRFVTSERLVPADRVRVVHYAVQTRNDEDPWSRVRARERYGMTEDELWVLVASRLIPHKGHGFLLEGFAKAVMQVPRLKLMVAGEGPLRSDLEARASELPTGAVQFVGFVAEIEEAMCAADVVVFPSMPAFGEGFGLVNLEAMALGRAVVASAVDSVPEIVEHERTGLLVAPGDADALAAALVRLATDSALRLAMGKAAHDRAASEFPVARMADRTIEVYGEALSPGVHR